MQKRSYLTNASIFHASLVLTPIFVLNENTAEMHVLHQILCISTCSQQNNEFYTSDLKNASVLICL